MKHPSSAMLYYRFHAFPVDTDASVGATFARITGSLAKADGGDAPVRFCLHGRGCADIVAKFPHLRRFLSTSGPQRDATPTEHLSNYGPDWPGAFAGPAGDMDVATIAAVMNGIPASSRFVPYRCCSVRFARMRR